MKIIYKHEKNFKKKEAIFIKETIKNSFPEVSLIFKKNKIFSNRNSNVNQSKKIIKKIIEVNNFKKEKVIFSNNNSKKNFKKDPLLDLKKKREVLMLDKGLFIFQGNFLKIFRRLNIFFYNLAIKKYKAEDQETPSLWPLDLFKKINYFDDFPQHVLMVGGLKKTHQDYRKFRKNYGKNKNFSNISLRKNFENAKFGLQPAVCNNCYYALRNKKKFKNTIFTTYNKVFRDEYSSKNNLDRITCFSVRDIMFLGSEKFVLNTRKKLINSLIVFLKKTNLNCSIEVANDPFFISNIKKKIFQDAMDLKYEILADIPFLKKKIAIGSINYHYNTFSKALSIQNGKKLIFSGCIGIGFERLVFALYSQFGTNINNWPKTLKSLIKLR